jgi:hypothetical protein
VIFLRDLTEVTLTCSECDVLETFIDCTAVPPAATP